MTFQRSRQAYGPAVGTTPTRANLIMTRDPNSTDVGYEIGTMWQNTSNLSLWYLNSFTSPNGILTASWITIEANLASLSDTANTPVFGSALTTPANNIQFTSSDNTVSIVSNVSGHSINFSVAGNDLTLATFGSIPNANGLSIVANVLNMQPADGTHPGGVSTTTQTFAGVKTLSSAPIFSTLTGILIGNGASAVSAQSVTLYDVLVGGSSNTISSVGPGSAGQVLQSGGNAANPVYSTATFPSTASGTGTILRADGTNWVATTATYPATTTINRLLYSSSNNVIADLATANRAVLTTGTTGIPVLTVLATDGQLIIGSTAGVPAATTLTAGSGINISNGSNSITISASGSGFAWTDQGSSTVMVAESGYFATAAVTLTLPASPSQGDTVRVIVDNASTCIVAANTGQTIRFGTTTSTVAGTFTNTARGDSMTLTYRTADTTWLVYAAQGTWGAA